MPARTLIRKTGSNRTRRSAFTTPPVSSLAEIVLRALKGSSIAELAFKAGVSGQTIDNILAGTTVAVQAENRDGLARAIRRSRATVDAAISEGLRRRDEHLSQVLLVT